jgi:hypothetical protein
VDFLAVNGNILQVSHVILKTKEAQAAEEWATSKEQNTSNKQIFACILLIVSLHLYIGTYIASIFLIRGNMPEKLHSGTCCWYFPLHVRVLI